MKCHKGRKISIFLVSFFIAMLTFFGASINVWADTHRFEMDLFKCPVESEATAYDDFLACVDDYKAGNASIYSAGASVEPGTYVVLVQKFVFGGNEDVFNYNAQTLIDNKYWEFVEDEFGYYYITLEKEDFPYVTGRVKTYPWNYYDLGITDGNTFTTKNKDSSGTKALDGDYALGYIFIRMKDDAPAGETSYFIYDDNSSISNYDPALVPLTLVSTNLVVAGGELSDDNTLKSLNVIGNNNKDYSNYLNPTFEPGSKTPNEFSVVVPYDVTSITINAEVNDEDVKDTLIIKKTGGTASDRSLSVGDNDFSIQVTSLKGNVATYTIKVYRLNNIATLNGISFTNSISIGSFNSNTTEYTINNVPYATTDTNITATLSDSNASIKSGDGAWTLSNAGSTVNKRTIEVEAENCKYTTTEVPGNTCDKKTYTINLYRLEASSDSSLSGLTVDGVSVPGFASDKLEYTITPVANSKTSVVIGATVNDTSATIESGTGTKTLSVGDNALKVVVSAEDGTKTTYTINIKRLNNNADLASLNISSTPQGSLLPSFSSSFPGDYTYSYTADVTSISITAKVSDEDGATVYLKDVTNNTTTASGVTANANYGTDTTDVAAIVTAEDGTIKTYSIKLSRGKSSNNYLSSLTVDGESVPNFKAETKSYNIEVDADVTSVEIEGIPADNYAKVTSGNGPHNLAYGSNSIEVVVQAENGNTLSYFVNITRKESSDATLRSLTVDGVSVPNFSPTTYTYTLNKVPYTTTSVDVQAVATDANARGISGTGTKTLNTGNNQLVVTVTAQDNSTKTYTINIEREKNSDNNASGVTVKGIEAVLSGDNEYKVTVGNSVDVITPSDVVITVPTGATVSKPTANLNLNTGDNSYTFTVTAEDNTVKTYEIIITREKNSDNSIGTVTLTLDDGTTKSCVMSGASCSIEVPANTTNFDLSAVIPSTATIDPVNGTNYIMGSSEKNKAITLTVIAENGDRKSYIVNVSRLDSSNNNLKEITVDGVPIADFDKDTNTYRITVPNTTTEVTIGATVEDTDKATITSDLSQPFSLSFGSGNNVNIIVKAENGQTKTYVVNITRETGADATLKSLTIDGVLIDGFDPTKDNYTITGGVSYDTTKINVGATPNDENAKVDGTGEINLHTDNNKIEITVTAQDNITKKVYTVNVVRAKNTDTGIKGITVAGNEATLVSGNTYEVTVPNNVTVANNSNVVVTVNDPELETDAKATYSVTETMLGTDGTNNVAITVTSEAGSIATYNVIVTREKASVATLDSVAITGGAFSPSFNSNIFDYKVTVPEYTEVFNVVAKLTDPNSKIVSGTGSYTMSSSSAEVKIVVLSEDGKTTNTYTFDVERTKSSVNTLDSITVSHNGVNYALDPTFSEETTKYTVNVPGNVDKVSVDATTTSDRATIEYGTGEHDLNVGANTITIRVRSESGSPIDYTITVNRAPKTDALLTDLTIDGETIPHFDPEILEYNITPAYPNDKETITIGATLSDSDAKVIGTGPKNLSTGDNTFEVTVTAQDGTTTKTYIINVAREKNDNNYLSVLSINGGISLTPSFDKEIDTYNIVVSETKTTFGPNDLTALPEVRTSTVAKGNEIELSTTGINSYTITVTAENGSSKVYTINVKRPKSTDATLKDVNLVGASITPVFSPDNDTYTINVPYGATSFEIEGIPNVDTTIVSGNGKYNVADQNSIELVTTAEAGLPYTKTYTFNIVEALSNDATLAKLEVPGYPFDKNFASGTTTYSIGDIPYGTTELLVNATPTNTSSTLEYLVGTNTQASNRVTIPQVMGTNSITVNVTAPDGITTKPYIITYTMVLSDNAYLKKLEPSEGSIIFNKTTYEYELNVADTVDSIDFDIETDDANAGITVNGESFATPKKVTLTNLKTGNNVLSVLVTAQDGKTTKTYNVVIKKAEPVASSDATLSALSVEDYPLAPDFYPDTEEYAIGSIPFSLEELTINATPSVAGSNIRYLVNGVVQTSNVVKVPKENGTGVVVVQVTAEDGNTVKNYNIKYSKTGSDNAYLKDITLSEGTIDFNKTTLEYEVNVDDSVNSIDITAFAEDESATLTINGRDYSSPHTATISPLNDGANSLVITVTAEDGTKLNYKVTVIKGNNDDDDDDDDMVYKITSEEYGHEIDDDYILTVVPDTTGLDMKDQLDNENEYLEIYDSEDENVISDGDKVGTGMIVKLIVDGEEKDRKVIVIRGDTNGDGNLTPNDSTIIINHYLERRILTGAFVKAADVNKDDDITPNDATQIQNHYLQRIDLFATT